MNPKVIAENLVKKLDEITNELPDDEFFENVKSLLPHLIHVVGKDFEGDDVLVSTLRGAIGRFYGRLGSLSLYYKVHVHKLIMPVTVMLLSKFCFRSEGMDQILIPFIFAAYGDVGMAAFNDDASFEKSNDRYVLFDPLLLQPLLFHNQSKMNVDRSMFVFFNIVSSLKQLLSDKNVEMIRLLTNVQTILDEVPPSKNLWSEGVLESQSMPPFRGDSDRIRAPTFAQIIAKGSSYKRASLYIMRIIGEYNLTLLSGISNCPWPAEYYCYPSSGFMLEFLGSDFEFIEAIDIVERIKKEQYLKISYESDSTMLNFTGGDPIPFGDYVDRLSWLYCTKIGSLECALVDPAEGLFCLFHFASKHSVSTLSLSPLIISALAAYCSEGFFRKLCGDA